VSVDVWFTQDIRQIILAAVRANEEALAAGLVDRDPPHERAYHQGFRAALSTMALALGVPMLPTVDEEERCTVLEASTPVDTAPGFLANDGDGGRAHELALPCIGRQVPRGDGLAVV